MTTNTSCNISNLIGYNQTDPMSQSLASEMSKTLGRPVAIGKSKTVASWKQMWDEC